MPEQPSLQTEVRARRIERWPHRFSSWLDRSGNIRRLAVLVALCGMAVILMHEPLRQPEGHDAAIYDYMAQTIARGGVPYRDVVENKAPGGPYLSALAMWAVRPFGMRDLTAARMLQVLMVGLLSALIYAVAEVNLQNRVAALIAFLVPLVPSHFSEWMAGGTEPKLAMILFGMLSLLMIAYEKAFWAGFCSMLSCLCWQPGLMFTGVAFLVFSRYLTSWRDLRALKVLIGASIPLAAIVLYFYSVGALGDLWGWTVDFNFRVYGPETRKSLKEALVLLWRVLLRVFGLDLMLLIPSVIGFAVFAIEQLRSRMKSLDSPEIFRDAILLAPLVYGLFTVVNFQSGPDLIPFFPFIGIFGGWFVVRAGQTMDARYGAALRWQVSLADSLPIAILIVLALLVSYRSMVYRVEPNATLEAQERRFAPASNILGSDDKVYVHGMTEMLALHGRQNLNRYVYLDRGKDKYAEARTPGGFNAIIDEMEAQAPKVVAIGRLGRVAHRDDIQRWVNAHYDRLAQVRNGWLYVRKQP